MTVNAWSAKEVTDKVLNKEALFVLDVRNESDYKDWKIEGENFAYFNIPYFELLDGVEEILEQLPKDEQVLVVCAKEGSSLFVAEMLVEEGFTFLTSRVA